MCSSDLVPQILHPDLARELTDEEILEEIDTLILERMRDSCLSLKEKVQLRQELFHSVRKLDVLQELIEDETVTEIIVNGPVFPSEAFSVTEKFLCSYLILSEQFSDKIAKRSPDQLLCAKRLCQDFLSIRQIQFYHTAQNLRIIPHTQKFFKLCQFTP